MNISERIKHIREIKKISQTDVANALMTERSNYHRLENRGKKLTLEQVELIANALQISVQELLGFGIEPIERREIKDLEEKNLELKKKESNYEGLKKSIIENYKNRLLSIAMVNNAYYMTFFENGFKKIVIDKSNDWYNIPKDNRNDYDVPDDLFPAIAFKVFMEEKYVYDFDSLIRFKIIEEERWILAWERFKYINPFYFQSVSILPFHIIKQDNSHGYSRLLNERINSGHYNYDESEINFAKSELDRLIEAQKPKFPEKKTPEQIEELLNHKRELDKPTFE